MKLTVDALGHACVIAGGFVIVVAIISLQCYLHCCLPRWLPHSFTVGESAIIAQATATFLLYAGRHYLTAVSVHNKLLQSRRCCFFQFSVLAKRSADKSIFKMTYFVLCGP